MWIIGLLTASVALMMTGFGIILPVFARRLAETACGTGATSEVIGAPYGTDAATLSRCGAPVVVFGPGGIEQVGAVAPARGEA